MLQETCVQDLLHTMSVAIDLYAGHLRVFQLTCYECCNGRVCKTLEGLSIDLL